MHENMVKYPDDACIVARPPWWSVHYSPSEKKIHLDSTDYHSGPLQMTRGHLVWLIEVIDNWSAEYRERILGRLRADCKDDWLMQIELLAAESGTRQGIEIVDVEVVPGEPEK